MPKDNRIFITLAVDMDRHPKFASLNDAQKWLIAKAIMHCREYLTDGQINMTVWRKLGTDRNRKAVLATGVCSEVPEQNCVIFHDYAEHNQTRAEVDAAKEKARSAGQKGGLRKAANARRNHDFDTHEGLAPASDQLQHPLSENVAEIEIEKERTTYVPAAAYVSNASDPENGGDASTDLDSWKLVQHTCRDLRGPTKTALRHEVDQLLRAGATHADITAGLADWMTRPKARPGLLGHLVDDATKARIAPTGAVNAGASMAHHDRKTLGWEEAAEAAKRSLGFIAGGDQPALPAGGNRPLITILDSDYVEEIA